MAGGRERIAAGDPGTVLELVHAPFELQLERTIGTAAGSREQVLELVGVLLEVVVLDLGGLALAGGRQRPAAVLEVDVVVVADAAVADMVRDGAGRGARYTSTVSPTGMRE